MAGTYCHRAAVRIGLPPRGWAMPARRAAGGPQPPGLRGWGVGGLDGPGVSGLRGWDTRVSVVPGVRGLDRRCRAYQRRATCSAHEPRVRHVRRVFSRILLK